MAKLYQVLYPLLRDSFNNIVKVLKYVEERQVCTLTEISEMYNMDKRWLEKMLKRLASHGIVKLVVRPAGKVRRIFVLSTNRTKALLDILNMEVQYPENVEVAIHEAKYV